MKNLIYIAVIAVVVVVIVLAQTEKQTANPEDNQTATNDTVDDKTATSSNAEASTNAPSDPITVTTPVAGNTVGNPIAVLGQARGYWFFEASAPVVVTNWDGLIIGEGYITAQGDWMTENYVPFTGSIDYDLPADSYSATGTIIFERANPSGRPENAAAHEVRVQLTP